MPAVTRAVLRDYLHDALPDAETAAVEKALRESPETRELFDAVRDEADRGEHSLGAVWRRERLSCPSREHLGGFVLKALDDDLAKYIAFHLETVGCAYCRANLDDLQKRHADAADPPKVRHTRIVKSGAGVLAKPIRA